jgi:hypothetical protein
MFLHAFIYLTAALTAILLGKRLGVGAVLGYLLVGIVIDPWGLGLIGEQSKDVMHTAEFGVVLDRDEDHSSTGTHQQPVSEGGHLACRKTGLQACSPVSMTAVTPSPIFQTASYANKSLITFAGSTPVNR